MKNTLFILVALCSYCIGFSESPLKIVGHNDFTLDVQSNVVEVNGISSDYILDVYFLTINEGVADLDIKIVRTEIDAVQGTENDFCWGGVICQLMLVLNQYMCLSFICQL